MHSNPEDGPALHQETASENEVHLAVAEKIQEAISRMLDQKIERLVEQKVRKDDVESAADRLFKMAAGGSAKQDIEQELREVSSKIASELLRTESNTP
jgi:uncharacterized small protein (DUF1192 family)